MKIFYAFFYRLYIDFRIHKIIRTEQSISCISELTLQLFEKFLWTATLVHFTVDFIVLFSIFAGDDGNVECRGDVWQQDVQPLHIDPSSS